MQGTEVGVKGLRLTFITNSTIRNMSSTWNVMIWGVQMEWWFPKAHFYVRHHKNVHSIRRNHRDSKYAMYILNNGHAYVRMKKKTVRYVVRKEAWIWRRIFKYIHIEKYFKWETNMKKVVISLLCSIWCIKNWCKDIAYKRKKCREVYSVLIYLMAVLYQTQIKWCISSNNLCKKKKSVAYTYSYMPLGCRGCNINFPNTPPQ